MRKDHRSCNHNEKPQQSVRTIEQFCTKEKIKLTPLRKKILAVLVLAQQPLTAYAVLAKLQESNPKAQVMSVYRVLDFLIEYGLIHRIEKLNAFMLCCHLAEKHVSQWLICDNCGDAEECALPVFANELDLIEQHSGFTITDATIELSGFCQRCGESKNNA